MEETFRDCPKERSRNVQESTEPATTRPREREMKRLNEKNSILCYRAYLSEINSGFSNWYVEWLSVVYASPLSLASLLRLVRGFVSRTLPALPHRFLSSSNLSPPFEYLRLSSPSRIIRLFPRPWLSLVRSLARFVSRFCSSLYIPRSPTRRRAYTTNTQTRHARMYVCARRNLCDPTCCWINKCFNRERRIFLEINVTHGTKPSLSHDSMLLELLLRLSWTRIL